MNIKNKLIEDLKIAALEADKYVEKNAMRALFYNASIQALLYELKKKPMSCEDIIDELKLILSIERS